MNRVRIHQSGVINASPEAVYSVLADYRSGHPAILPKPYFTGIELHAGGYGAGTALTVRMEVLGVEKVYHMVVSEPTPGRVLVETDAEAGVTTTFTVEPIDGGVRSRVTIATESTPAPGMGGVLERLMNPPIARRIYRKELQNLAAYVQSRDLLLSV